jgi:hypothetical protein
MQTTNFIILISIFSSLITKHNWRHNRHNHGRRRQKWPPSTPHEALRSALMLRMHSLQPTKLADVIFWGLRVCMALKALLCSSDDESQRILRAIHTLNGPKNCSCLLGRLSPIHKMGPRGAQGLIWGAGGPFPPAAAMVGYGCVGQFGVRARPRDMCMSSPWGEKAHSVLRQARGP